MRIKRNGGEKTATIGEIGKVKIGELVQGQNGKSHPVSLDYFRCDAAQSYQRFFTDAYGEKPDKLSIVFLTNDPNEAVRHFYELRDKAGKRIAYGDGATFFVAMKQQDGTVKDVAERPAHPEEWRKVLASKFERAVWKEVVELRFVLPKIPVVGTWRLRTGGDDSSIPAIVGAVDGLFAMTGRILGVPFDLSVKKVRSDKTGSASVYPVLSLVANVSAEAIETMRTLPASFAGLLTNERLLSLAAGNAPAGAFYQPEPEPAPAYTTAGMGPESLAANPPEFSEYEEIVTETFVHPFLREYDFRSAADYTAAAAAISASQMDDPDKVAAAKNLSELAKAAGLTWVKEAGEYQ